MKKTLIALAAITAGVSVTARGTEESKVFAASLDVTYVSDYIFRGLDSASDSIQPSIEATYGDFYAGVWYSDTINNTAASSEIDLYAGYNQSLNETFSADFGLCRYLYNDLRSADSTEAFVGLKSNLLLSPSVYSYYDFDNKTTTFIASIGYSVPLKNLGIFVDLSALAGLVQRSNGLSDYNYWGLGAAVPYRINDTAKLTAAVNYSRTDASDMSDSPDQDQVVFSFGLSLGF